MASKIQLVSDHVLPEATLPEGSTIDAVRTAHRILRGLCRLMLLLRPGQSPPCFRRLPAPIRFRQLTLARQRDLYSSDPLSVPEIDDQGLGVPDIGQEGAALNPAPGG